MKKSEKIFSAVKSFLGHTGFYFTLIVMAFNTLLTVSFPNGSKVFETAMFGWILLFSAVYALSNFVLDIKFIDSYLAKISIHYVLVVLDFAVVMAWLSGAAPSSKNKVFVIIAFAFVYLIVEIVRAVFHNMTHRKNNEKEEYQSLFSSKN
jgi:hypothetical protein